MSSKTPIAALDIGTNSFHLIVATASKNGFDVVAREKSMVRLGEGTGDMKTLSKAAIERGLVALKHMSEIAHAHSAPIRAVATSAVREASNASEFVNRALKETGVEIEVISGVEEARLIHLGVQRAVEIPTTSLIIDIGGGSTELIVAEGSNELFVRSVKLGAIRLTNRFFPSDHVHPAAPNACRSYVRSSLAPTVKDILNFSPKTAIVSSGTAEALARMVSFRRGGPQPRNFNKFNFTREELSEAVQVIESAKTLAVRREIQGLDASRADIILAGAIVLQTVVDEADIKDLIFSDFALREGLLLDTLHLSSPIVSRELQDASLSSVEGLMSRLDENPTHSRHVANLALQLFDQLVDALEISDGQRFLLESAALLSNVGLAISHSKHHLHSYYIIKHADMPGFREHDVELIAQIARYHRKSKPKLSHEPFVALDDTDKHTVRAMAALLRIAIGLDRSYDARVQKVSAKKKGAKISIKATALNGSDLNLNLYSARERADLLEDVTGCTVDIT
ncbi:MAG: Ppx/GppA family phosphatase [Actinobacteria bacterium]|nr:Ppx/GppA family phosphatase [Actinomycetota bacterium]